MSERIILHSLYALNMLQIKCMYVHIKDVIKYEYIIQTARIMNRRRTFYFARKGARASGMGSSRMQQKVVQPGDFYSHQGANEHSDMKRAGQRPQCPKHLQHLFMTY